jgi:hypothetical protein
MPNCDEWSTVVHGDYAGRDHRACPECIDRIREDMQDQLAQEEFNRLEEEYYLRDA